MSKAKVKVLVVRKTDKTIHVVPLSNKATLMSLNNRSKLGWTIEEMDEDEAAKLPFIDENYVTPAEAQKIVVKMEATISEKDAEIEKLKALLAEKEGGGSGKKENVGVVVEKINLATTAEEVDKIVGDDDRAGVLKAAEAKKATF